MKQKILVVAGGTGGHMFPAICFTKHLLQHQHEVLFVTDQRGISYLDNYKEITNKILSLESKKEGVIGLLSFVMQLFVSFVQSLYILFQFRPDKVVGFSGFPTFATLVASVLFRKKIFIHEQNAVLGKVNRLLIRFTERIFISTRKILLLNSKYKSKTTFVGMPVRSEIAVYANNIYSLDNKNKIKLLVTGGSQGASSFSNIIPRAISLLPKNIYQKIEVVHQAHKDSLCEARLLYDTLGISYKIYTFIDNIAKELDDTDLVIARAGASTVAEVCALGKPAIFIPYPYASDDHQKHNAQTVKDKGACLVLEHSNFTPTILSSLLIDMLKDKEKLVTMSIRAKKLYSKNATQELVDNILSS